MGIPIDLIGWFEDDMREYEHAPIDEETRITLSDMIRQKDAALYH